MWWRAAGNRTSNDLGVMFRAFQAASLALEDDLVLVLIEAARAEGLAKLRGRGGVEPSGDEFDRWMVGLLAQYCGPLRCVMGNPFRAAAFEPAWRTPTAMSLAQAVYDERAFDRLPVLADALEEAGCDAAEILGHCRQKGGHILGCWVVNLVLRRS